MNHPAFKGDQKHGDSLLSRKERKLLDPLVTKIPIWIKSYHLTLSSLLWSFLIILFSYFAKQNINWMWLVSFVILLQYLTDYFDGTVGRYRKEGLIKWGYYMDHFLDYIFLSSILGGYFILVDGVYKYYVFSMLVILVGFMINSFLYFSVSEKFNIYYFKLGPTEERIILIIVNSLIVFYGKSILEHGLPYMLGALMIMLIYIVYNTQKEIWLIDLEKKNHL